MSANTKVVVVGGGPVGALAALYAARRGYDTELYELRGDPNHMDPSLRPDIASIPVTLSDRGLRAIAGANVPGLLEEILDNSIEISTRMVHETDGSGNAKLTPMAYGPHGECHYALQRDKIAKHCLLALEKEPTAKVLFNYRLVTCDFERQIVGFESVQWEPKLRESEQRLAEDIVPPGRDLGAKTIKHVSYGFLIGADGTHSSVRQGLMRKLEVDFSQTYLNLLWCDLSFSSNSLGSYGLDPSCMHIWPADESIVIAQPNLDGSFRAGMICPTDQVRYHEQHLEQFARWFKTEFSGIVPNLLSVEEATVQFLKNQKIPLKSMKINKLGYEDSVLLLGDSVHTMAPFHGIGMVTGLEDVHVFFQRFRDPAAAHLVSGQSLKMLPPFCPHGTVAAYAAHRLPDVHAIVDLGQAHFGELRNGIRSPIKRTREALDLTITRWVPSLDWTTLYARIHFGDDRFSDVVRKDKQQEMVWISICICAAILLASLFFSQSNITVDGIVAFFAADVIQ